MKSKAVPDNVTPLSVLVYHPAKALSPFVGSAGAVTLLHAGTFISKSSPSHPLSLNVIIFISFLKQRTGIQ